MSETSKKIGEYLKLFRKEMLHPQTKVALFDGKVDWSTMGDGRRTCRITIDIAWNESEADPEPDVVVESS